MEGNGRGEEKVKGKEEERWREGFGPHKNVGVAPPINQSFIREHRQQAIMTRNTGKHDSKAKGTNNCP